MKVKRGRTSTVALLGAAWLTGALAAGCSTVCDDAAEHEKECGYDDGDRLGGPSCEDEVSCASECFVAAPCGAFDGTDTAARDAYEKCLSGC